jgi:hypothetical protein
MGWNDRDVDTNRVIGDFGLDNDIDGVRLFSTDLLQGGFNHTTETYGLNQCKFEVAVVANNNNRFNIFIDCSRLEVSIREMARIEEAISFELERGLSHIFVALEENARSLNEFNLLDGDDRDGMVRATYEL